MKKYILLLIFIAAFQFNSSSQNCSNFCVLSISTIDTVGPNTVNVTIYDGDSSLVSSPSEINYPTIVVVDMANDTVCNKIDFFDVIAQLPGDTTVYTIPTSWDSIPFGFTGIVYLHDRTTLATCFFPYPMSCTVGINEYKADQNSFSVYPNPATSDIHIVLKDLKGEEATITLFDATGKKVRSVITANNDITIEREELPKGLYFVSVLSNHKELTKKIILQ